MCIHSICIPSRDVSSLECPLREETLYNHVMSKLHSETSIGKEEANKYGGHVVLGLSPIMDHRQCNVHCTCIITSTTCTVVRLSKDTLTKGHLSTVSKDRITRQHIL